MTYTFKQNRSLTTEGFTDSVFLEFMLGVCVYVIERARAGMSMYQ